MSVLDITQTAANFSEHPEEYVMEYQVESERGFHVLGSSVFSANTLFTMDPAHFTSIQGEPLGAQITDFEVPDDSWVWAWSRWYVDMSADVDDQGWCYSWRFRSSHWSSRHRLLRSFVRQRIWKRPRVKRSLLMHGWAQHIDNSAHSKSESLEKRTVSGPELYPSGDVNETPNTLHVFEDGERGATFGKDQTECEVADEKNQEETTAEDHEAEKAKMTEKQRKEAALMEWRAQRIISRVRELRNDRERINEIMDYISKHPEDISLLVDIRERLLATLNYGVSKRSLITRLAESTNKNCRLFIVAPSNTWRDQVLRHGAPDGDLSNDAPANNNAKQGLEINM